MSGLKPIVFSPESVRGILNGSKTQSRRVIVPQPERRVRYDGLDDDEGKGSGVTHYWEELDEQGGFTERYPSFTCPYGPVGGLLWVREPFTSCLLPPRAGGAEQIKRGPALEDPDDNFDGWVRGAWYDGDDHPGGWAARIRRVSPRFMPRWASRITLELTGVRVERLQDITEEDALAEGYASPPQGSFLEAWDGLNAKRGYGVTVNPWVFVLTFVPHTKESL